MVLHDELWAEKQISSFAVWLNHTLSPSPQAQDGGETDSDAAHLKTVLAQRQLSTVRWAATQLYHADDMRSVRSTVEREVSKEHLKVCVRVRACVRHTARHCIMIITVQSPYTSRPIALRRG